MSEEITGVCVDIPTIVRCAKMHQNDRCSHFNYPAEFCSEGFAICSGCKQRYSTFSYEINRECFGEKLSDWISVADRLPEVGDKYLCCVVYTHSPRDLVIAVRHDNYWIACSDNMEGRECDPEMYFDDLEHGKTSLPVVTHWQYLPEPPKI